MSFTQPFSDYEILARVGSGAMGTVFRARQKKLNRIVALKVLRPSLARDTHYVDRLRREARIVASLNHPNIVAGYDLGEEGGYHFFVMEYFDGPSLRTLLGEWGMFPEEQVLDTAIQVVKALAHAFRKGVIHRDIKPGNILIDSQGKVKLTDMGLAKGPTDLALTRDGATVGTPQYISPEQARNPQECDIRSDLYSLGATLYHMATGQTPFPGDSMAQVITKVLHERAASATDLNPKLSDGLSLVIRKLMAKDPDLRYQTPAELLEDLQRVRREEDPEVDLQGLEAAEASRRAPSAWRRVALGLAFVAVIASSIWVGSMVRGGDEGPLSPEEFARQLELDLEGEETYRDQLDFLERAEAGAANADHARTIAVMRGRVLDGLERDLNRAIDDKFETSKLELDDWIANWRDPDAWIREVLSPQLADEFGYSALPGGEPLGSLQRVRQSIRAMADERDSSYLKDLDQFLENEFQGYRELLAENDFKRAQNSLSGAAEAFFSDERAAREQLPDSLGVEVDGRLSGAEAEARGVIAETERAVISALEGEVARRLGSVAKDLAEPDLTPDFELLRERVGNLRMDLEERYPPPARFMQDPWPGVMQSINRALGDISFEEQNLQSRQLARLLSLAYSTLAQRGDFRGAEGWLDIIEVGSDVLNDRLNRHRAVLTAAGEVAHVVLRTLSGVENLTVHRRVDPNRELTLVVKSEAGQFQVMALSPAGTEIAGSLIDLRFSDLLEQAMARNPDLLDDIPNAHQGVALCLFISNQFDEALEELSKDERNDDDARFFGQEIWPMLERVFVERDQALSGEEGRAFDDLLRAEDRARQGGSIGVLRRTLDEFRRRFPTTAEANSGRIQDMETWLLAAERRRDLARDLQNGRPDVRVAVDEDLRATVTYPPEALGGVDLPEGWSPGDDSLDFTLPDVSLSRARELQLVLDGLPLLEKRATHLRALLRFPGPGEKPRAWLFECDGIGVALGLLANNSVVVAVLELRDCRNVAELNRALQEPLREAVDEPAFIVPGAIHELSIEVNPLPSSTRLEVEVLLDDLRIASGRPNADRRGRVAVVPLQPLSLVELELSGDFR